MVAQKKPGAIKALIKQTRADLGLSQTQFAKRIKTTPAVLQRWESGTTAPSGLLTARLVEAGVAVGDLIEAFEADAKPEVV